MCLQLTLSFNSRPYGTYTCKAIKFLIRIISIVIFIVSFSLIESLIVISFFITNCLTYFLILFLTNVKFTNSFKLNAGKDSMTSHCMPKINNYKTYKSLISECSSNITEIELDKLRKSYCDMSYGRYIEKFKSESNKR